jgi:predicted nucleic acid-binding protein
LTVYFAGTSAIAKRYVAEAGSMWVKQWADPQTGNIIAARNSIARYPLRALDAIQLASAVQAVQLLSVAVTFASADQNLLAAAAAEGFSTDDPNAHP